MKVHSHEKLHRYFRLTSSKTKFIMAYRLQSFSIEFGISHQTITLVNLEIYSVCVFKQLNRDFTLQL